MPDEFSREIDFENDILLRRLDPQLWDPDESEALPVAFEDSGKNYSELSFYIERCVSTPVEILRRSSHYSSMMRFCGTWSEPPTVEEMLSAGYGIARVPASVVKNLNLTIKPTPTGEEINKTGHVNVVDGRKYGIAWADNASIIPADELRKMSR